MNGIFSELKRRHVFRVVGLYAVAGWLLMQLANHFEDSLNLPAWFDTFVTLTVLLGFPVVVVLAWIFDLTPEGFKKTENLSRQGGSSNTLGQRPHLVLLSLLVVAVGFLAWQFSKPDPGPDEGIKVLSADDKSIAVLPFIALSANQSDVYFGKGLAEELLNALTKFPELKVAARTSAFSFEGQHVDLRDVGKKLGVAHVLKGSVRSAGERVRVTAQLIRVEDGFHLWSEAYDGQLSDLFSVQDEIVSAINRTLQIHLGVGVGAVRAAREQIDAAAYQNYLRGLELWGTRSNVDNRRSAIRAFELTTIQAPEFADGWAAYGASLVYSEPQMSGLTGIEHSERARQAFERALAIDPDNVRALAGMSVGKAGAIKFGLDIGMAQSLAERAVEIAPNASLAHYARAWVYEVRGEFGMAERAYERAIALDPLNEVLRRVRVLHVNASLGDYAGVARASNDCKECSLDDRYVYALASYMAARRGGTDAEVRESASVFHAITREVQSRPENLSSAFDLHLYVGYSDPVFVKWLLGGERPPEESLAWMRELSCDVCDISLAPVFAAVGEYELAFEMLNLSFESQSSALFYVVDPLGREAWPDDFRRDPRFHAFWQREGMAEIAEVLRSNGITGGLPLPPIDAG